MVEHTEQRSGFGRQKGCSLPQPWSLVANWLAENPAQISRVVAGSLARRQHIECFLVQRSVQRDRCSTNALGSCMHVLAEKLGWRRLRLTCPSVFASSDPK